MASDTNVVKSFPAVVSSLPKLVSISANLLVYARTSPRVVRGNCKSPVISACKLRGGISGRSIERLSNEAFSSVAADAAAAAAVDAAASI